MLRGTEGLCKGREGRSHPSRVGLSEAGRVLSHTPPLAPLLPTSPPSPSAQDTRDGGKDTVSSRALAITRFSITCRCRDRV